MKIGRVPLFAIALASIIIMCLMMIVVPGCQKEAKPTGTITLYTSVPTAIIEELKQEFEAENPGVYLEIYRKGTSAVVEKINQEIAAGQVQADVIWVANFIVGEELKGKGVLLPWTPPEATEIPDILKDEDGYYYAGRLLIMVVAYNTDTVATIPTGYKDLLDKRYHGRIGHDTPETSGSLQYFMGTLLQDANFGEEFFIALAENAPQIQTSTKTTQRTEPMATTMLIPKVVTNLQVNDGFEKFRHFSVDELVTSRPCERKPVTVWEVAAKMENNDVEQASALLEELAADGTLARFKVGFSHYYASPKVALTGRGPTLPTVVSDSLKNLLLVFRLPFWRIYQWNQS